MHTKNMWLEHKLAHAPLAWKYTDRIFESKDGTTSMKIVNYTERHNFGWNDLLTKSNRTEIQTYQVEERTFGTPCSQAVTRQVCIGLFSFHFVTPSLVPREIMTSEERAQKFSADDVSIPRFVQCF